MSRQLATFTPIKLEPYIDPQNARTMAAQPAPSLTIARGTILGQITSAGATQGMVTAYNSANSDGSQIPIGPSVYDFTTDSTSAVTLGPAGATYNLLQGAEQTVEYYWKGTFLESDLTGLDANAVTKLVAREIGFGAAKMLHIA